MSAEVLKRSPLYEEHIACSARMVPFAGWEMPVYYSGIIDEHHAVREAVGMFDISHMGELAVSGPEAAAWLDTLLTNDVGKLQPGQGQYTLLLNESGGVIDDLILYRTDHEAFFLVVNAARIAEDHAWLKRRRPAGVALVNESEDFAAIAIQGPGSAELGKGLASSSESLPSRNGIARWEDAGGSGPVWICRTGYTGEDGFELFAPAGSIVSWWRRALDAGAKPSGLGARDTLRLEMCYPLNGSDLTPERTPLEAGLGFFVDLEKPKHFVGQERLQRQRDEGLDERLAAFMVEAKGPPPRAGYEVFARDERIGEITSGCASPSLGKGIGMAYLPKEHTRPGSAIDLEIRGRRYPAAVARKPLYKKDN